MIIEGQEYKSYLYGSKLKKIPEIKKFGINEKDIEECKAYDDAIEKYNSQLNSCIENRGYYLAVPLWIAEYSLGFACHYGGMLEKITIESVISIAAFLFVWGILLCFCTFLGGQFVVMLQAWGLKWIIPKFLVRNIVRLIKRHPQKSNKYDKAYSFLQVKHNYEKLATEYREKYPNIQIVNYDLDVYGQIKLREFLDKVKKYIAVQNEIIKKENIRQSQDYWFNLNPYDFEHEVAMWYERKGYKSQVTKKSGDGGVDIIVTKGKVKAYVQCKRYTTSKVDGPTLNQLYGVVCADGADYGIVVCLLGVTDEAKEFAHKVGIKIVTISELCPTEDLFHQKKLKRLHDNVIVKINDHWCKVGNIQIQSNIYVTDKDLASFTLKWENSDMYHPVHYGGLVFCFYCAAEDANDFEEWLSNEMSPCSVWDTSRSRGSLFCIITSFISMLCWIVFSLHFQKMICR